MKTLLSNTDIERYETMVKAVVNKLLLSRRYFHLYTEREDLYQIGWVILLNCQSTFDISRGIKFETYASKAIYNGVVNELKRLILEQKNTTAASILDYELPKFEDDYMKRLVDVVENTTLLTKRMKQILWLRFIDEQSFSTIGKTLGISGEYARRIHNQSVKLLKEYMSHGRQDA